MKNSFYETEAFCVNTEAIKCWVTARFGMAIKIPRNHDIIGERLQSISARFLASSPSDLWNGKQADSGKFHQTKTSSERNFLQFNLYCFLFPFSRRSLSAFALPFSGVMKTVPVGKPVMTIAHNTSSNSIYLSWKPPALDTIFGEFLGYRITYRARDVKPENVNEILIRESSVEVSKQSLKS